MGNMLGTLVAFAFATTLAFAAIEWTGVKLELVDYWNPRKLPPVKDPNRISRGSSLFEIGAVLVFFAFFMEVLWPRPGVDLFCAEICVAPAWRGFLWVFSLLCWL